jgi:drug/metabolite transporter (DMT)-like permease
MSAAVETIPPLLMTALRFFVAAPILLAVAIPAWRRGEIHLTWKQVRSASITGVLLLVMATAVVGVTQQHLDTGYTSLLISVAPIWMAIFTGIHIRRWPNIKVLGALIVGLIGIAIMAGGPGAGEISVFWTIVAASTTIAWSIGTVASRFMDMPKHPTLSSGLQMLVGGLILIILSGIVGEWQDMDIEAVSTRSWTGLIWLIIVGSLISYSAYMYANNNLPIEIVSTYAYVNPVVAVILGVTLDNDSIGPNVVIGGTVILLAVVFIVSGHVTRRGPIR